MLSRFRDATIAQYLYSMAGLVIVGFVAVMAIYLQTRTSQDRAFVQHMEGLSGLREAVALDFLLIKARYSEKEFIIRPDDKYVADMNKVFSLLDKTIGRAGLMFIGDVERQDIDVIGRSAKAYASHWDSFVANHRRLGMTGESGLRKNFDSASRAISTGFAT
ncbi:MAG: hypothetical protein EPN26_11840, partial [Rhodospirillales bacterium]